ncbi:hypothetical protein FA95DRAFT_1559590 [Auriscalpium vulgare]|uniref:Uncharacterized protein n=1 Tax=Auriscalpium vulgare TaxID=40419 RepID=A0ACB8RSC8_9AGAM|nr:hypothetical protein FA95DRAFT_1559590 [Auriscalpium vulgare]
MQCSESEGTSYDPTSEAHTSDTSHSADAFWASAIHARLARLDNVTAFQPPDVIQDAFYGLDTELVSMQRAMRAILTRRNSLLPISRLPSEILGRVFSWLALIDRPTRFEVGGAFISRLGWISATHVCRWWRDVALDHATLWGDISFTLGQKWVRTMFARSRLVPLSIDILSAYSPISRSHWAGFMTPLTDDLVRLILQHMHHTRRLLLDVFDAETETRALLSGMTFPAPMLEELALKLPGLVRAELQVDFLGSHAPKLRQFTHCGEITSVIFPTPAIFHNLESLDLFCAEYCRRADLLDLLNALEGMPRLQDLRLNRCLRVDPEMGANFVENRAHPIVELPALRECKILEGVLPCAILLKHIRVAPTANTHVNLEAGATWETSTRLLFPILVEYLCEGTSPPQPITKLRLSSRGNENHFSVKGWRDMDEHSSPRLNLELHWRVLTYIPGSRLVLPFFRAFTIEHIHTLDIMVMAGSSVEWDWRAWADILGPGTRLEHLTTHGVAGVTLCQALYWRMRSSPPFLPSLASLTLELVGLDGEESSIAGVDWDVPWDVGLARYVENRSSTSYSLKDLTLTNCDIADEDVQSLRRYIRGNLRHTKWAPSW